AARPAARESLLEERPATSGEDRSQCRRRDILLAGLLVEMSVHNNTSGVMKGFHHGWGGRGGDALGRIMAPVELEALPFLDGPRGRMHVGPAHELPHPPEDRPFDVAYLDPPYTIHQYGANYHLLTSAVRRDRYDPGPVTQGSRAGIRTDHYRSDHCRSRGGAALRALQLVLERIRTRTLLVSYNNDGLIRPQEMLSLLSEDGAHTVHLLNRRYHKFRGGKSTQGAVGTREYLFVVRRGRRQDQAERAALRVEVQQLAAERDLHNRFMAPSVWAQRGGTVTHTTELTGPDGESITLDDQLRVRSVQVPGDPATAERAHRRMEEASGGPVDACRALVAMEAWDAALRLLQRLKIKKYRADFLAIADDLDQAPLTPKHRQQLAALRSRVTS
ncbi:MAG: DNA adenine methylase, partial [Alkalispirochaeta sp.]